MQGVIRNIIRANLKDDELCDYFAFRLADMRCASCAFVGLGKGTGRTGRDASLPPEPRAHPLASGRAADIRRSITRSISASDKSGELVWSRTRILRKSLVPCDSFDSLASSSIDITKSLF